MDDVTRMDSVVDQGAGMVTAATSAHQAAARTLAVAAVGTLLVLVAFNP
jgi:hypothetical protein